jgi:hypothetical protein
MLRYAIAPPGHRRGGCATKKMVLSTLLAQPGWLMNHN